MKSKFIASAVAGALLVCAPLPAQQARSLSGSVLLGDAPVAGVPVTLHRVTSGESGVVANTTSGSDGSFRFALPPRDSSAFEVYFATADYLSVRYFGEPLHGDVLPPAYVVAVRDTASALPGSVRVARRDLVLLAETGGGWEANEIVQLENSSATTLVPAGGLPTWEMTLPTGATDFQAGEGDQTATEIALMGDRVLHLAPVLPGRKEIFLRYRIPGGSGTVELPVGTATDSMHVFIGQPAPAVEVTGLTSSNVVDVQGQQFVQYGATALAPDAEVAIRWDPPAGPPVRPELAGVAAAALVLLIGSWVAIRRAA